MPDVTKMEVKVDLTCEKCKKKIKKVLCQIPEIENQEYDKKNNTVTITVVCCKPEKIKKKICCKGGDKIKAIKILTPEKPKPPEPGPKPPEPASQPTKPDPACPPRECCKECYVFHVWGPYYPWPPCYCSCHGCHRKPGCDCRGSGCSRKSLCGCRGSGCSICYLISEENPTACTIL